MHQLLPQTTPPKSHCAKPSWPQGGNNYNQKQRSKKKRKKKKKKRHTNRQKKKKKEQQKNPAKVHPLPPSDQRGKERTRSHNIKRRRKSYLGGRVSETKMKKITKMEKTCISTCSRWSPSSRGWLGGKISKLWGSFPLTSWQKPSLSLAFFFFLFFILTPFASIFKTWFLFTTWNYKPLGLAGGCEHAEDRGNTHLLTAMQD